MSLTGDRYSSIESSKTIVLNKGVDAKESWTVNPSNPFAQMDYAVIIKAFEIESSSWQQTDYAKANHYRDVYSTRNFSERVRQQMDYYPGMHQSSAPPETDPFYTNADKMATDRENYWNNAMESPTSFMSGLEKKQKDFDYTKMFGTDASAEERAKEIGKMITECIPCFGRLLDGAQLLPDGDLLEIHALNIKIRTDLLDKIMALFKDPGAFINICDLLKFLTHLCPQDLLAIVAVLTQYLAKLNLDFKFNIDFIIQLVGPILSPFLDALAQWLDKWIQLILGPMTCVIDHINETILIAQDVQIPFSDVSANVSGDLGIAMPAHNNAAGKFGTMQDVGLGDSSMRASQNGVYNPHAYTWEGWQWEEFNTPDSQKYNPTIPEYPTEETELAFAEAQTGWTDNISAVEREERDRRWKELKAAERAKRNKIPPPDRQESRDGTRWSKDDIPASEKYQTGDQWSAGSNPPEKQTKIGDGTDYFVTTPLVGSIVELRNILQGAIQYIKDWFDYLTQMIYDLLGTDFGWMSKKTDNTMIKSRLIELILLVKSVIEAISKNGLECGLHSNYDQNQMRYILEGSLNKVSKNKFTVLEDGTIKMTLPGQSAIVTSKPSTDSSITGATPGSSIAIQTEEQKTTESGIIIKDCFKTISKDELAKVKNWIADFESRGT